MVANHHHAVSLHSSQDVTRRMVDLVPSSVVLVKTKRHFSKA